MLIGPSFIWFHLPKTGGTSTARLFRQMALDNIIVDDDDTDSKHDSLNMRFAKDGTACLYKKMFITLRRLPDWLISDWHHKTISMGLDLPFEPVRCGLFYSLRLGGTWVSADYWLNYFSISQCDDIIRLEHLDEDANRIVHPLLPEGSPRLEFSRHNANDYSRNLNQFIGRYDIRRIYANNPLWEEWEGKTYGNTTQLDTVNILFNLKRLLK